MQTHVPVIERNMEVINTWLKEISEELNGIDREDAWIRLGAVLQTVRDRILVDEAAHFAAQLPVLIRGTFYADWHPADTPQKWRNREEYLEAVNEKMSGREPVDAEATVRAVLKVVARHIDDGEIKKVREAHPKELWDLWPS